MPWKYTEEYYREYTRTTWNEAAEAYVRWMRNLEPFRAELVRSMQFQGGEKVLDLGTGPGEPALSIAELVGATGHVTGVDLSEKMVEIARGAQRARAITQAEFLPMDCAHLGFPDGRFDAAVSSFGFQIFTDPEGAARETHRVLRSGGRIGVEVWSTAERVPFLHVLIGPMLEHAEPDETGYIPTPYETGGPGEMVAFLKAAGFRDTEERQVAGAMQFTDPDEYLRTLLSGTPIGHSLSEETEAVQQEVLAKTRDNLQRFQGKGGLTLPAEVVLVTARK